MPSPRPTQLDPSALRRSAERQSDRQSAPVEAELGEAEARRLLHELQVHQIELEMQNAELQRASDENEVLLDAYTDLYDYAPVGYVTLNDQGEIQRANLTAARLLRVERSSLLGRPFLDRIDAQGRPIFEAFMQDRFTGATESHCELPLDSGLGTVRWIRLAVSGTVRTQECRMTFVDNTDQHQAEEERLKLDQRLRDQQFYTRSLIESNVDALITTDPQGLVTDVNKQMEVLTGLTRTELIGASFETFFADPARARLGIRQTLREGKVTDFELTTRDRNGKETVVSYNATTFYDREQTLQGVFAAAHDVTEHRRLDRLLQEQNKELLMAKIEADQANRSKSNFLSSMSHELRSPLNAILGFAQLLEAGNPPPTQPQKANVDRILQAGWHLLNLINQVLDLSKVESGNLSLSSESVSLKEALLECEELVVGQAQLLSLNLIFPTFKVPCTVHADRTRLKQVLINLLSNAVKYNRKQGTIEVTCTTPTPGSVRISIKDTGEGLSPEQLQQLFEPFNRLGRETSGEEGTGIGLVVAKQLVELMGGHIGVESTPGVGSIFWFDLLVGGATRDGKDLDDPEALLPLQTDDSGPMRTLLYVEDNPANLALVEQLIARRPRLHLLTATTAMHGIALAREHLPELILMDINLPDISGIEALRVLRQDPLTAHIPVIAISANAMTHDLEDGARAGFFCYLTKPFKIKAFFDALQSALALSTSE